VIGIIDQAGRALLTLSLAKDQGCALSNLQVWIDTAFDGELVMPLAIIRRLGLQPSAAVEATLADGSKVALATYACNLDWFGERREIEVIANEGRFPLLGVALLKERRLVVDYRASGLSLD
jgi:clan AA aspartic protease